MTRTMTNYSRVPWICALTWVCVASPSCVWATGNMDLTNKYAWAENIGWLQFKGVDPDYNVRTVAFDRQPQGTSNWWLALHNVAEDYDEGDTLLAWQEYVADTDPTNSASFFYITLISKLPLATVTFLSSSRRYYALQRRDNLLAVGWTNVMTQTDIQGAGGLDSLQDTTAAARQFYRVGVKVLPSVRLEESESTIIARGGWGAFCL